MKQFTHLLLTKFNTAIDYAPSTLRFETKWLTERLELFERYCFPSVEAQRRAEFEWLVFFDAASPEWLKEKIASYQPLIRPIFLEGPATDEVISRTVRNTGLVSAPYLVTTRLDNDDAISRDHLASVQAAFERQEREFVTFPCGLQSFRGHLYNVNWPANPFLSLIERVGDAGAVTTVFCVRHDRMGKNPVRKIRGERRWLQVLHGSNLGNVLRGWPRLKSKSHPNFEVIWPENETDSVGGRIGITLKMYGERADRYIRRMAGLAS